MRVPCAICFYLLLLAGCKSPSPRMTTGCQPIANQFVAAFYSFNKDSLQHLLSSARGSQPSILYYQEWAECGNYAIVDRGSCIQKSDSLVLVPVTVKDDLINALQIDFHVTDTFHLTIGNGQIRSVTTSSNDPDVYYEAKEWVKQNRPELIEKACEGIWDGGPTPCACVQGMVKGFAAFMEKQPL